MDAKLDLVYVDFGEDEFQVPSKFYPVKLANAVPGDGSSIKGLQCDVYLTAFYCHNLPDWDKTNEAMLTFKTKYVPQQEGGSPSQEASFILDFRVRDAAAPGGFLHRRIFKNVKWDEELELQIGLVEVDEKVDINPVLDTLRDTGILEVLDLSGYAQYIELASKIYDGITALVVKNDPVWNEPNVVLRCELSGPGGGAAALKKGTYCLLATTDSKGHALSKWTDDYSDVFYKGKHLHLGEQEVHLATNYMIFSLDFH